VKKHIVKALKWALSKFEDKKPKLTEWPFPAVSEDFDPRPVKIKAKPALQKATTRKPAAKKIVKNVEKIVKKKAK